MNRRKFIGMSVMTGGSAVVLGGAKGAGAGAADSAGGTGRGSPTPLALPSGKLPLSHLPDLKPASWIWYPSERTLPNTFVLFRRELSLAAKPTKARGWICGDSRYKLEVNGQRLQWGPAPCDPRWTEADPVDLTKVLSVGKNVLGATVLYFGHGDGTWPFGRPGFLFWLELEYANGTTEKMVSDATWQAYLCRAWQPGWYKRWFLRALQEKFDARLYPYGWSTPEFQSDDNWLEAMTLEGSPNKPALSTRYQEYLQDPRGGPPEAELRARTIPLLDEPMIAVKGMAESLWVKWRRPAEEYFENRGKNCFTVDRQSSSAEVPGGKWNVSLTDDRGALLTFELTEQVVGFPYFSIRAPVGTVVDLTTQEGHEPGGAALLYTTRTYAWARFVCREGENTFECFDFESLRWVQLHIQGRGAITVHTVGVRRRLFPWKNKPVLRSNEPALQRLFDANANSVLNAGIDQYVDGNGRERQQYGGECAHQVYMSYLAFGDPRLPARYIETWSQGMTKDGYFLDCWPAYDRLARAGQRQLDVFHMGTILDHAVQFTITAWKHYLYTGQVEQVRECYPRLLRFANYLIASINRDGDGLLPVLNLGVPWVWLDYEAYKQYSGNSPDWTQRRKQCAYNLYVAGMFEQTLVPMCVEFGDRAQADQLKVIARGLVEKTVARFWSPEHRIFVDNLPWLADEKELSFSDRALATAVLFDYCPRGDITAAIRTLAECPKEMGFSHPQNAHWRLWALSKGGRIDVALKDLRERWATLISVKLNNALGEQWLTKPDTPAQWSHASVAPVLVAHLCVVGVRPLAPGFKRAELQPQLGDLEQFEVITHTGQGPIHFQTVGIKGSRTVTVEIPAGCSCELLLREEEKVTLASLSAPTPEGYRRYQLPEGRSTTLQLAFT